MGKRGVRIVVIVEDEALDRFARSALGALGFDSRDYRILPEYPKGGLGSGKKWVTDSYVVEVRTLRKKNYQRNIGILVGTDANELTVAARAAQLDAALAEMGLEVRNDLERVAIWIPRWSIETWGVALTGKLPSGVREDPGEMECRSLKDEPGARSLDWKSAGKAFAECYRRRSPKQQPLPSIRKAWEETDRLTRSEA
jgi:hypothetical protein